ncbi:MAG: MlaD family protein, partial [Muribaculaceae bacterium]|nr:MlaD family protein [Muribaculaceae bacterium]
FLKGINVFKAANYYYASYTNVEGLAISAPVTVNGYKVGQVREINYEYDNPGHVKVELSLDKDLKVPKGTKAILVTDLLGTASIALSMPQSQDYHNVGDVLIGENSKGLMDNLSTSLMPSVEAIVPKIDTLLTSINLLVGDPALLASVQRLDAITANLEATTASLNATAKALPAVMGNVNDLTVTANRIAKRIDDLLASIDSNSINSTLQNLSDTSASLKQLAAELNNPNGTVGKLIKDPAIYNNLNQILQDLDKIVLDIKDNPKRYIPAVKLF